MASFLKHTSTTQEELARRVGVSQEYISRIASGRQTPRPEIALRLARIARVPLDSFARVHLRRARGRRRRA